MEAASFRPRAVASEAAKFCLWVNPTPHPAPRTRNKQLLKPSVLTDTPPHPDAVAALAKLRFA